MNSTVEKKMIWKVWRIKATHKPTVGWTDESRRALTDMALLPSPTKDEILDRMLDLRILVVGTLRKGLMYASTEVIFDDDVIYILDVISGEPLFELERYSL